jgi:hypothetical protein
MHSLPRSTEVVDLDGGSSRVVVAEVALPHLVEYRSVPLQVFR